MDTEMSDETDGHRSNARMHGGMRRHLQRLAAAGGGRRV